METFLENFLDTAVMLEYLPQVTAGFWVTLRLGGAVVLTGLLLGFALAFVRAYQIRVVNFAIVVVVDVLRAIPPLVLMIIVFFALPLVGISLSSFVAAWLCLAFVLAAFAEEIFWAGITAVNRGQWEAARSTGLGFFATLLHVVMPQAVRMTIPPLTNRTITITKNTALASVVAVEEMLNVAQTAQAYTANTSPLTLAAIGYLIIFFPLTLMSRWVERRFAWKH